MRRYINLVESVNDIIPGELPGYNTLAKQLSAVNQDGNEIYNIENSSERVQLAAVHQDRRAIAYIKNPSEVVQLAAVSNNGYIIQYIRNPSENVQLAAVKDIGSAICYILAKGIVPSISVQRAAIIENPVSALRHMINYNFPISKMIQWTAAKRIKEWGVF